MNRIWGLIPLIFALCGGCRSEHLFPGATGVGNPGKGTQQLARGGGLTLTDARVEVTSWLIDGCAGHSERLEIEQQIDLLEPASVDVPGGSWCGLSLILQPPLIIEGIAGGGEPGKGTFRLELQSEGAQLVLTPPFLLDEHTLIFELGYPGWISETSLKLEDGVEIMIDEGHPRHDELIERLGEGSALYLDGDGDGRIDHSERDQALASGPLHRDDEDEEEDDD
ncbi:MAG TPA: hypothetical protein ENK18_26755 [Deltaproteobacteria bacterium]|nr:hypothetical protein [Deltaproteobacteria bacterium]